MSLDRLEDNEDRGFAVTHRAVLAIAVPMTLAFLTTPLLGLVDTAVVGRLGDAALLGGLAAGAIVFDLVFATFNFLRSGTTGLVAQAFGSRDREEEFIAFWRAAIVALGIGLALLLLSAPIRSVGAAFMDAGPAVTTAMTLYVGIRILCAPFALLNYAILGYVLGRGEGTLGLALQLLLNGVNIALSIWLGLGLGWGIEGVAWGTVAAEMLACIVGLAIVARRQFRHKVRISRRRLFDTASLVRMFAMNGDIMIRSFVLLGAFALMARQGAAEGTLTLAANAVLMNFFLVAGFFLDGFATAAEQLAGRAIGARHREAFRRTVALTAGWGFALAIILSLTMLLFGDRLIAAITTAPNIRLAAGMFLPWAALTPLTGVLAFQMDGVFIGATWSRDMRNMMLLSFAVYVAALFGLGAMFGNHGLWAALNLFLTVRGISLLALVPGRFRAVFG